MFQDSWHDVGLLGNGIHHSLTHLATGIVEDDRRREASNIRAVVLVFRHIRVVAGDGKDGVLVPRLFLSTLEEMLQGHVGIAYYRIDFHLRVFVLENIFISVRYSERMVTGQCEQRRHKGLLHVGYLLTHILHERLVANTPPTIIFRVTLGTWVSDKVFTTIVLLELRSTGEGHKAHRTALSTMEESRLVTFAIQTVCQSRHVIDTVGRQEERLDKHWYRREYRRHAVNRLAAIAIAVAVGQCPMCQQRVGKRGLRRIAGILVIRPYIFSAKTLNDNHHHILLHEWMAALRLMNRGVYLLQLLSIIIGNDLEVVLADGTYQRERGIQHQTRFCRTVAVVIGIRHGDRTNVARPTATHTSHAKRYKAQ